MEGQSTLGITSRGALALGSVTNIFCSISQAYSSQWAQVSIFHCLAQSLVAHVLHPENNRPFSVRQPSQSVMFSGRTNLIICLFSILPRLSCSLILIVFN